MIKICVFIAISCINIYENEADNTTVSSAPTIPKLDFWSPDPKFFESRRKMQDASKENKIYFRHGRGKTNFKSKRSRHDDDQSKKPPQSPALRTRDEETSIWPRARHGQHKERTGTEHGLSTRMTPMYLMQQPNEGEPSELTTAKESTTGAVLPSWVEGYMFGNLNPYTLEQQIREILSSYPDVNASIEVIGRTVEYNNILLVKLSEHNTEIGKYFRAEDSKYIEEVPEKKIVFIVHGLSVMGIHAPYGPRLFPLSDIQSFVMLLRYYIRHLDKFDIFLMPMANPDGYLATKEKPYWNKNMSPQSACEGVALDRNFDVAWNTAKVYSSCSQLYPGPAPFSEVETKAVRDVLHHYGHKIIAYIHVHAGSPTDTVFKGEAVLYPKGFTEIQSDDDKYIDLRGEIDEMMKNASFQVMTVAVETLHNWYGKVSGSSVDYASTVYGIPYALEFVMQLYKFEPLPFEEQVSVHALTVIWQRIIDIFFHNIWKNLHANDVK